MDEAKLRDRLLSSVLLEEWDGASLRARSVPEHGPRTHHQMMITCSGVPLTGEIRVRGRPREGVGFAKITDEMELIDLTAIGSARFIYTGFFDAYEFTPITPAAGVTITITIDSVAYELLETSA